jgi:tetratricopeptide (TPR) repeat protein
MDFAGALSICESVLPSVEDPPSIRFCLILAGSAQAGLGNYERALELLLRVRDYMDRQVVIFDWYRRLMLESGLTELWLAKGDLGQARAEAELFLKATLATAERTWQALAWEANARVAMAQLDIERAEDCITKALSTMEGFEVPLAGWRVHATSAELCRASDNSESAVYRRQLSRTTILTLADSLEPKDPLCETFLSAPAVHRMLGNAETTNGVRPRSPTKQVTRSAPR